LYKCKNPATSVFKLRLYQKNTFQLKFLVFLLWNLRVFLAFSMTHITFSFCYF